MPTEEWAELVRPGPPSFPHSRPAGSRGSGPIGTALDDTLA